MTLHHLPVPGAEDAPDEAPPGFAAVLRSNWPPRALNWLVYLASAVALRFIVNLSPVATALTMAVAIPATTVAAAAAEYMAVRFLPRRGEPGADGEEDCDGR
jgi:hypothetical protein